MAELFKKKAVVDHIPGEDDVDPSILEEHPQGKEDERDYRDSNANDRYGNSITGSVIPKEATELVRWRDQGRSHIALKAAGKTIVSWWDEHVGAAIRRGELDPKDMHTSAYNYAAKHNLLRVPPGVKRAALFNHVRTLTFVDPESDAWAGFVEQLRNLPDGSTIQTQDGYTLTKDGNTLGDGDILFLLEDFEGAKDNLMPPMAVRQAAQGDKTFIGQHRQDGSWSIQEVSPEISDPEAREITQAPDGNKAQVILAPSGDAAKGMLYEDMTRKGVTPVETTDFARPTASLVLKAGNSYLQVDEATKQATLVEHQYQATRFASKTAAVMAKATEGVLAVAGLEHVRVIQVVPR